MRVTVRVYPAAKRTSVGGRYGSTEPPILMVRVTAPAVDGKANDAVLKVLSIALRMPRRNIRIVSGVSSRTKVLELEGGDEQAFAALASANAE